MVKIPEKTFEKSLDILRKSAIIINVKGRGTQELKQKPRRVMEEQKRCDLKELEKIFQKLLKKPLDKPENLWYNKITKGQGQSKKPERIDTMANKMTYVMALTSAIDFLSRNDFDPEVVEKLEACKASYEKRNASKGERKPSKKQVENEALKGDILAFLMEEPDLLRQAKDVGANFGKSSQWASALLRQMVEAGTVEKVQEKRTTYFKAIVEG